MSVSLLYSQSEAPVQPPHSPELTTDQIAKVRKQLVEVAANGIQSGKVRQENIETVMTVFYEKWGSTHPICQWVWSNDPYDSGFLLDIYNDAADVQRRERWAANEKKKPDILTGDTIENFFAQVPGWLLIDHSLSSSALRLVMLLMIRAGKKGVCWPSQVLLAREMGLCDRQVRDLLKELEEYGAIDIERRRNKPSLYKIFITKDSTKVSITDRKKTSG